MNVKQRRSAAAKKSWRSRKKMHGKPASILPTVQKITRADRIRALLESGKTCNEVAALEGCHAAYVRTVRRRSSQPYKETACYKYRAKNWDAYLASARVRYHRRKAEAMTNG